MNAKLFINYRREDTGHAAGRLYDRLIAHFGEDQVFIDIDQIEPGEDFVEVINGKVGACDIAIVAIGPNWLHATDASGKRRLDDEEDFVRMEIVAALQRKIRVIPVLVGGARMPGRHDLPEALAPLSRRNAIELSETRFHVDVNRLIEAIERSFAVVEKKTELPATPVAPPPEPATVRPPEPESKDLLEPSESTKPAEPREPEEIDAHAVSGAAPVSPGETARQVPTEAAPPYRESERSQQDSVATAKDSTKPMKSTRAEPAAPPPEPAGLRPPEPESKDLSEPSESTKPAETKEPKEIDADAVVGAPPVSLGEATKKSPTRAARSLSESERTQQDSVVTAKDAATVKSTQTTPAPPQVPSTSWIAALKKLKVWTWERRILVSALVLLLVALAGFGIKKAAQHNRTLVANLNSPSTPAETQLGVSNEAEKKPTPAATVTLQKSSAARPQPRATESESARTAETPAETPSSQSKSSGGYDPAMAFVDMQRIFKEYNKTKDAEVKINDAKNAAKKEYDDKAEAYKKALDEINNLNKQLESPALSAAKKTGMAKERDDKIANIRSMEREINDFRQTRERQLQEQLMRMREGIVKEITDKIRKLRGDVADIIFDKSGISINGVPVLMYSPDSADMSDKVIRALNNGSPSTFTTIRNLKMAAIDMQSAFKNYNKTKDGELLINNAKNAAKKEYDDRAEAYKKALDEINNLNKQLESPALSAAKKTQTAKERDDKIANIKNMEREINDFRQTRERQLQEQLMRMREGIVKEITGVVMNAVKAKNIGVVLDISGMSMNGVPVVIYRQGIPDFTDEVVATLNKPGRATASTNSIRSSSNMLASTDSSRTLRFGVIDMNRAFKAWPETKASEAKINDAKNAAKKEYDDRAEAYKKALDEINNLNKQLESPALSADKKTQTAKERDDKIANIKNMEREISDFREKREKQLEADAIKLREPITAKIAATVNTCAERAGFNLVFDSSGNSINGVPVVVFARDLPDLTDAVLKEHDRSH